MKSRSSAWLLSGFGGNSMDYSLSLSLVVLDHLLDFARIAVVTQKTGEFYNMVASHEAWLLIDKEPSIFCT
jgi:hypothetical protein